MTVLGWFIMACPHSEQTCLHKVPIFESLTESELDAMACLVQSKRYEKGDFIFREGEKSQSLFVVNEGHVKLSKLTDSGKEQITRFLFPGDFFGQFALLQDKTHYANAEVLDSAVICFIRKKDFQAMLETNAKMAYRFLLAVSERLQQADEWMGTISLLEVGRRLAKVLLLFDERSQRPAPFQLPVPKKELAAWIGTTPETLSRKLSQFQEQGLIAHDGKKLHILEPLRLKRYAESAD